MLTLLLCLLQVKGLEEALIITKRVHFQVHPPGSVTYKPGARHCATQMTSDQLSRLTRDAGINFEADIPLVG